MTVSDTVPMSVSDALASRRSVRAFTDRAVDMDLLHDLLERAQRAPSGGNVQPWMGCVLTGEPLTALIAAVAERMAMGLMGLQPDYVIYPDPLGDPWMARRREVASALYGAMGIARGDRAARDAAMAENFEAFGAPVLLFVHCPRLMGPPQWADMGIWLQTVMLLLREAGLDSCPQEAWAMFGKTVREAIGLDDNHILYCGLAIGWRDAGAAVNNFNVPRAPLDEVVRWLGP
ncbi:MAG: nitroreductase [Sphingopyxis sp.]